MHGYLVARFRQRRYVAGNRTYREMKANLGLLCLRGIIIAPVRRLERIYLDTVTDFFGTDKLDFLGVLIFHRFAEFSLFLIQVVVYCHFFFICVIIIAVIL